MAGRIEGNKSTLSFNGLHRITEIIPQDAKLHERLRRTSISIDKEASDYDQIAQRLSEHKRVLCIVNTRRDAREIYNRLPEDGYRIHLSRMMCPYHIKQRIVEIKQILEYGQTSTLRVVSTQLIEAGVDIDFPVVFRQEAGLDSILQAAGRCNREGKLPIATTYVFKLDKPLPKGYISLTNSAREILGDNRDYLSPDTMTDYFKQVYLRACTFDKAEINEKLYTHETLFESAASSFRLIDEATTAVIVNYGDATDLVATIKDRRVSYSLRKQLMQYSVNVRNRDFLQLQSIGAVEEIADGSFMIAEQRFYSPEIGLTIDNKWTEETYIL